jgi:Bifunctional DNA primase/polymerase, N-terminal
MTSPRAALLVALLRDVLLRMDTVLAKIECKHGSLPPTCQVETGKGRHLYFRYPKNVTNIKSVARKKLGLDVRADGGYVIALPSTHGSIEQLGVSSFVPARHSRAPSPPRLPASARFLVSTTDLVRIQIPRAAQAIFRELSIS